MFDFVSRRKWFYLFSALIIIPGIISMATQGLKVGIEFSGGWTQTMVFESPVIQADLKATLDAANHPEAAIEHSTKDAFLLQGPVLSFADQDKLAAAIEPDFGVVRIASFGTSTQGAYGLIFDSAADATKLRQKLDALGYQDATLDAKRLDYYIVTTKALEQDEQTSIQQSLVEKFGAVSVLDFNKVTPTVAGERVRNTGIAVAVAAIGMILYIAWAFRKLVHPLRYGVCAVISLIHDAFVVLGVFSLARLQVDSTFILAVLTVIGYSVNDTIVVFDRIRENSAKRPGAKLESVVNLSLTETMTRSLNTSLTTLFALVAVYMFGGASIQNFALALIIGIVSGTYSSIFNASQLVVSWERGEIGRLFRWIPFRRKRQEAA